MQEFKATRCLPELGIFISFSELCTPPAPFVNEDEKELAAS